MNGLQVRDSPASLGRASVPIDPRILARMVSVRRERRQHHWRRATVALAVLTAVAGAWAASRSPVLAVGRVEVVGGRHTGRRAVLAAAGLDRRRQMLDLDAAAIERRVLSLPWVAQAHVHLDWPTTVTIGITERVPRAQVGRAGQIALVDGSGRVLATGAEAAGLLSNQPAPLPELQGVGPAGAAGSTLSATAVPALALVQALTAPPAQGAAPAVPGQPGGGAAAALAGPPASVVRAPDGTLAATWSAGPVEVVFGSVERLGAKVFAARSLLAQIVPGGAATIDVRVVDAPVLTNGTNRSMVSTTQRG